MTGNRAAYAQNARADTMRSGTKPQLDGRIFSYAETSFSLRPVKSDRLLAGRVIILETAVDRCRLFGGPHDYKTCRIPTRLPVGELAAHAQLLVSLAQGYKMERRDFLVRLGTMAGATLLMHDEPARGQEGGAADHNSVEHARKVYGAVPAIAGNLWKPARNPDNTITDSNWRGLPLNRYVFVDAPTLLSKVEKPYYVARSGAPSWTGIVNVWNGAAWNPKAQEMFITGGGHYATSSCETAIYRLKASTLLFDRARDRDPQSENGSWSIREGKLVFTPGETFASVVLKNSQPGALHTYHGILWVPPDLMAIIRGDNVNVSGGIFQTNIVRYVYDLDAKAYVGVPNWRKSPETDIDISDSAAFIEGTAIYGPHHSYDIWKWELARTQDTNWSPKSTGVFTKVYQQWGHIVSSHSVWGWLPERRECFGFYGSKNANELSFQRCRYGQAIDKKAGSWTKYVDTLTLTSIDGSHHDFNKTSLSSDNMPAGDLYGAGYIYDHARETLYVQGSNVGNPLYKITGIAGNTWTTEKIPGTGALEYSQNGVFGRLRMAILGGQKIIIRVSGVDHKTQVMRIS